EVGRRGGVRGDPGAHLAPERGLSGLAHARDLSKPGSAAADADFARFTFAIGVAAVPVVRESEAVAVVVRLAHHCAHAARAIHAGGSTRAVLVVAAGKRAHAARPLGAAHAAIAAICVLSAGRAEIAEAVVVVVAPRRRGE